MGIVPPGYGQASGRGGSIGDYQGQFTATTVKQRAFDANDYIVFDNGTKLLVYLAPVDIPINSPAPGQAGALWGELDTTITSGLSEADLTARLRSYVLTSAFNTALGGKADTSDLADYLRTGTYNLDKARLESGITGNDNDISALMTALNTLQTQVNNLPTGGGGEGGGDVTTAALNTAIDNLRTALESKIEAKQDADTAATDTELADAVSALRTALQTSIDEVDDKFSGESLLVDSQQIIQNYNSDGAKSRRSANDLTDIPWFSDVPAFAYGIGGNERSHGSQALADYVRFDMHISEFETYDAIQANRIIRDSLTISFRYEDWFELLGVPRVVNQTTGTGSVASSDDGRALRYTWEDRPPGQVSIRGGSGQADRVRQAVIKLSRDLRATSRILYIGKSNETEPTNA